MDRRLFNRIEVPGATIQFKRIGSTKFFSGYSKPRDVHNLSKSGISFSLEKKFQSGDPLMMRINFPDGINLNLKGHIRWKTDTNGTPEYTVGIQFFPYGTSANYNPISALDYLRSMDGQALQKPESDPLN